MGQPFFSQKNVFFFLLGTINAEFSAPFLSKYIRIHDLGVARGRFPLAYGPPWLLRAIICIISGPFWFKFTEIYDFW